MIRVFVILTPDAAARMAQASPRDVNEARRLTRALVRLGTLDFEAKISIRFVDRPPPVVESGWSMRIPVVFPGIGEAELRAPGTDFGLE